MKYKTVSSSEIDSHNARPSQSFDIWAQLDHTPGKLGLLTRLCLEPDIDMNRLGHLVLSNGHWGSAEVASVRPMLTVEKRELTRAAWTMGSDVPPSS